jgi:hypothetical protein
MQFSYCTAVKAGGERGHKSTDYYISQYVMFNCELKASANLFLNIRLHPLYYIITAVNINVHYTSTV